VTYEAVFQTMVRGCQAMDSSLCVPVSPDGHSRKRAIHHIDGIYKFKVLVQNIKKQKQ
jgi:hypothetical protein